MQWYRIKSKVFPEIEHVGIIGLYCHEKEEERNTEKYLEKIEMEAERLRGIKLIQGNTGKINNDDKLEGTGNSRPNRFKTP